MTRDIPMCCIATLLDGSWAIQTRWHRLSLDSWITELSYLMPSVRNKGHHTGLPHLGSLMLNSMYWDLSVCTGQLLFPWIFHWPALVTLLRFVSKPSLLKTRLAKQLLTMAAILPCAHGCGCDDFDHLWDCQSNGSMQQGVAMSSRHRRWFLEL